jgi:hypothetical protein
MAKKLSNLRYRRLRGCLRSEHRGERDDDGGERHDDGRRRGGAGAGLSVLLGDLDRIADGVARLAEAVNTSRALARRDAKSGASVAVDAALLGREALDAVLLKLAALGINVGALVFVDDGVLRLDARAGDALVLARRRTSCSPCRCTPCSPGSQLAVQLTCGQRAS